MKASVPPGDVDLRQSLLYMMTIDDPTKLATYDAATKDSALYDDMTTTAVETRDAQALAALLAAVDYAKAKLGADPSGWRWGKVHTITFEALVSLWGGLSIPPAGDATFPHGFPRHGEDWSVDVGGYSYWMADPKAPDFTYSHGPVQRFVADMQPSGPVLRNVLPGGEVWDNTSPHFRDEAELWRRNQTHPVPMTKDAIVPGADEHVIYEP
jgi:penicillin amidase